MVDFSQLLRKPAGEAKKPPALLPGNYLGVIKSFEIGDNNRNKTPYVRFQIGLIGWPETVEEGDRDGIDLSKRQMRRDYYLTEEALWRLDDLLRSLGLNLEGRSYEETLPEAVGQQVMVEVQQYVNQESSEIGNQIGKLGAPQ